MTTGADREVYGEILVVAGALVDDGAGVDIAPTTGEVIKRLVATPEQLLRLTDRLETLDAFRALLLAIEHGTLALDPLRIEVPGWKREWLMEKGWRESPARSAVSVLKRTGFVTKVFGERGAAGGGLAVISGDRFSWPQAVSEVVTESGRRRLMVTRPATGPSASSQVSAGLGTRAPAAPAPQPIPVDNAFGSFGEEMTNRSSTGSRLVTERPDDQSPNRQVSAIGHKDAIRESTGATREEVVEEGSLLSPSPDAVAPLTRANLHRFLGEPRLREALELREVQAITSLAALFRREPATTRDALAFFGRPAGDAPDVDLAWFVYDLLTVSVTDRATVAHSMASMLRSQSARIPKMQAQETIQATVIALAAAMDTEPRSWPAFVVWAMDHDTWGSSTSIQTLVRTLNEVTFSPVSPAFADDAEEQHAAPVGEIAGLPAREPQTSAGPASPSEEEMKHRGEGYWQWLREEVIPGSEFEGAESTDLVLRSRRMQDMLIKAHRLRASM